MNGWINGYAFILSFLAPLWTICESFLHQRSPINLTSPIGSFDSSVHISEEASNAATAVPWAIIGAISIAGVLGTGEFANQYIFFESPGFTHSNTAINIALAFCMGTDLDGIMASPSGQPMAQIFFNSFGQKGTLAIWVCFIQKVMFRSR